LTYNSGNVTASILGDVIISSVYTLGTNILYLDETIREAPSSTYSKLTSLTITQMEPKKATIRISFDLGNIGTSVSNCYGRIYKNGVALGTERTHSVIGTYTTYSEDILFEEGDTIEFWSKDGGGTSEAAIKNIKILGDTIGANPIKVG